MLVLSGKSAREAIAWRDMAVPTAVCAAVTVASRQFSAAPAWAMLLLGAVSVAVLLGLSYAASPILRAAVKR